MNHKGHQDHEDQRRPAETLLEQRRIEIHEEAQAAAGQFEIGENLRLMEAAQSVNGFDFNDDRVLDQRVQAVACVEPQFAIADREDSLSTKRYPARSKSYAWRCSYADSSKPGPKAR